MKSGGKPCTFDITLMLSMYATGDWTYKGLGREFGKDHTTIMYSRDKIAAARLVNSLLDLKLRQYEEQLNW